jgi:prepilin-type N-terminal cleavage/methylation domain-containing protein
MPENLTKKRFTLIELLVVISIIAILMAMLLPGLARAKELSRRAICTANIKQLVTVAMMFAGDNDDKFPERNAYSSGFPGGWHDDGGTTEWGYQFEDYIPEMSMDGDASPIVFCPSIATNRGLTWRPSYQPDWRITDYAYWGTMNYTNNINWVSTTLPPDRVNNIENTDLPLFGDSLFEYQHATSPWFVSGHTRDYNGRNSYIDNTPGKASTPEGAVQGHVDGSARWLPITSYQRAGHHPAWGAIGGNAYQWWSLD